MNRPLFTIITATYNAASVLPRLLESLAGQRFRDFEVIIQDGASKDDSVALAESFRGRLPALQVRSAVDSGLYEAWNRAVRHISGQWVIFLGADDALDGPETLLEVARRVREYPAEVIFASGDVRVLNARREEVELQAGLEKNVPDILRHGGAAVHSGLFQRAGIFAENSFDTGLRICGDHDFICRLWNDDSKGRRLGLAVTRMSTGGLTSRIEGVWRFRWEHARVLLRHYGLGAFLPRLPGLLKGLIPLGMVKVFGPARAARLHNRIRKFMGKGPIWTNLDEAGK